MCTSLGIRKSMVVVREVVAAGGTIRSYPSGLDFESPLIYEESPSIITKNGQKGNISALHGV